VVSELVTMSEASERLGISKTTFRKRLRDLRIETYVNPKDTREKLVDWIEVEAAFRPRIVRGGIGHRG
jgi:DNA-binding Lrp family transcriptional regulator